MPVYTSLLMFLGVVAVSTSAILIKFSTAPALALSFYRLALSVLFFLTPVLLRERAALRRLTKRDWLLCLGSGLSLALHFYSWISSLRYTSVASSTVLVTANPFIVLLMGYWLLGERTNRRGILAMFIGVAGAVMVGWGDFRVGGGALFGDFLAVVGAITVSGYTIAGRIARQTMSVVLYSTVVYAIASAILLVIMLPQGVRLGPYSAQNWWLFVGLAVLPTVLGHTLLNWALKHVSAAVVSMSVLGEPVISTLIAWMLLGEKPGWTTLVGGVVLLVGIGLFVRQSVVNNKAAAGPVAAS